MTADITRADPSDLASIDRARAIIAKAVTEQDQTTLLELRARAQAIELYQRRAGAKLIADDAGEIKVSAERGLGQIDREVNPHGVKNEFKSSIPVELAVGHTTRAAWRKLGSISDELWARCIAAVRADENAGISTAQLIAAIRLGGAVSSTTFETYTPAVYVEAARAVLGAIDLDPASCVEANEIVDADKFFTAADNALERDWWGHVFLNPPYGRGLTGRFVAKAIAEYDLGNVDAAILLLNAYGFDAEWFQPLWAHTICFTDHRIKFYGTGGPTFGSLFAYLGPDPHRFANQFREFGHVLREWPDE